MRLFEHPARRWLQRERPWAATLLVNGFIMTLYLWHATALVWIVGLANALGGLGLGLEPASSAWWLTRPLWIGVCALVLAACIPVFARFEQGARGQTPRVWPAWRTVGGAVGVCAGLAVLAVNGIGGPGPLGIRVGAVLVTLAATGLAIGVPRLGAVQAGRAGG